MASACVGGEEEDFECVGLIGWGLKGQMRDFGRGCRGRVLLLLGLSRFYNLGRCFVFLGRGCH